MHHVKNVLKQAQFHKTIKAIFPITIFQNKIAVTSCPKWMQDTSVNQNYGTPMLSYA